MKAIISAALGAVILALAPTASAQQTCDIPREARDIWRCENGFVIGPENVIIRLPIPEADPEALYNAGVEAAQREDWRVAIAYFTAAHQRAHLVPRYMYNLGVAHARAGHEVAAVAWLSAFLIASPDAPNRAVVWRQISELETSAQRDIDTLWRRASQAAETLPAAGDQSSLGPQFFGRDAARAALSAARARASSVARYYDTEAPRFSREAFEPRVALYTPANDLEALMFAAYAGRESLARTAQSYTPPSHDPQSGVAERSAGLGDVEGAFAAFAAARPRYEALEHLPAGMFAEFAQSERSAARMGEIFLLSDNPAAAARAAALAHANAAGGPYDGWADARLQGLVLAEQGDVAGAIRSLETFLSRRIAGQMQAMWGDGNITLGTLWPFEPSSRWSEERFDAIGVVAEYLVWRGRHQDAVSLGLQMDSLRAMRFAAYLRRRLDAGEPTLDRAALDQLDAELIARATGGGAVEAQRRRDIERHVIVARSLSGAAYDLDWWLRWIDRRQILYSISEANPGEPAAQVMALIRTPESLTTALTRLHASYEFDPHENDRRYFPNANYPPARVWGQ